MFNCTLSFRASSKVLSSFLLVGAGLISWVPHFTTGIEWALRLGLYCLQQAQRPLDEKWVCIADFTIQIGCKKALIVLRVPVSAFSTGKALTLKQVEVIGLSLGETWNAKRVNTVLLSLFERCGWPSHVVSDCGSDIKKGIVDTLLEAPNRASWISDVSHFVANALKHYYAKLSFFQQFQSLCTRIRHRLQQTRFAFLLPPKARAKGRFLSASRQAEWGLQTLAYLEAKERQASPEAETLAQALRGLKSFKLFLMTFVRNTTCLNQVLPQKVPPKSRLFLAYWRAKGCDLQAIKFHLHNLSHFCGLRQCGVSFPPNPLSRQAVWPTCLLHPASEHS